MIIYITLLGVAGLFSTISAQKVIDANVGTFRGETVKAGQLHRFLGIPYAVAPLEKLRFTKPKKLDNFQFTYVANRTRSFCPQLLSRDSVWNNLPLVTSRSDEDCLYLNIYVPERNVEMPVMVFLDGDNFLTGRGDIFDGDELAIKGDVIVVTLNYRLGILGFFTTGEEEAPGNLGLWDQNLALHWVQDNIRAFGGDPDRVTLVGWSAGATSAALHALSRESKGLFSRVILQGGATRGPIPIMSKQQGVELAKKIGIQTNCYSADNSKSLSEMFTCLQTRYNPTFLIIQSLTIARKDTIRGFLNAAWVPVIDGVFLKDDPVKLLADKSYLESIGFYDLDIMLGVARNEGTHLDYLFKIFINPRVLPNIATDDGITAEFMVNTAIPAFVQGRLGLESFAAQEYIQREYNIQEPLTSYENAYSVYTDSYFLAPIVEFAQAHRAGASGTGNTYMYLFDHSAAIGKAEVPHGGELPYVFGFSQLVSLAYQVPADVIYGSTELAQQEQNFRDKVVNYWSNFLKTGDPNKPKLIQGNWPKYDVTTKSYIKLSLEGSSADDLRGGAMSFWVDCFPLNHATVNETCPTYQAKKPTTTTTTAKTPVDPVTQKPPGQPTGQTSKPTTKQSSGDTKGNSPAVVTPKATEKPVTRKRSPFIIIDKPASSCNSLKSNSLMIGLTLPTLFSIKYLVGF